MKKITLLMMGTALWSACNSNHESKHQAAADSLKIKPATANVHVIHLSGSTTIAPLAQKVAGYFRKQNDSFDIEITEGGSSVGIADLEKSMTDIAMSSRDMNDEERRKFQESNHPITEVKIADDALAVVVHPGIGVDKITRDQLEKVFSGEVNNWKQLGGKDIKIMIISRESSSGTYGFFKEAVMKTKAFTALAMYQHTNGSVINKVSTTEGAIGYVGLAFINDKVKALPVSFDGKTYVAPDIKHVKTKTYPLARPLFFIYQNSNAAKVKTFVDYLLSDAGQKEVEETGYVSLK
ncbi:phosphate ABC transporter substrate-binding protein [Chitinophaga silvisoli]|uniref:Phosphate-binding protein n=1 Tax=Chitinophaga silvisoli TaxID=2291814 RepID=A0A3E1P9I1_9BACT|nr:phosphate ABC transporter substrate-binding protein [Chitinophaga silvisoli]RFM36814.1 phosphate ABC transporter substrate-binding protein [Chitinophaga silvisoli]